MILARPTPQKCSATVLGNVRFVRYTLLYLPWVFYNLYEKNVDKFTIKPSGIGSKGSSMSDTVYCIGWVCSAPKLKKCIEELKQMKPIDVRLSPVILLFYWNNTQKKRKKNQKYCGKRKLYQENFETILTKIAKRIPLAGNCIKKCPYLEN